MRFLLDAPFKCDDGYGTAAEEILLAMDSLGVDVYPTNYWPHTTLEGLKPRTLELLKRGWAPEQIGMRMSQPNTAKKCPSIVKTLFSMWEFSRMPESWVFGANSIDVNFVPTTFCRDLWIDAGVKRPVVVAPLGVSDDYQYIERPGTSAFQFLQAGTLGDRKNGKLTVSAFKKAFDFEKQRDVWLILKSSPNLPFITEPHPRIVTINERWSRAKMLDILRDADCFVYPTHGEGFGLSIAEAMKTGLPCIVPIHTGLTDFVKPEHVYQVDSKPVTIRHGLGVMDTQWIDEDSLIGQMRHVYNHRKEAKLVGKMASKSMENWSWTNTTTAILKAV